MERLNDFTEKLADLYAEYPFFVRVLVAVFAVVAYGFFEFFNWLV